MSGIKLPTTFIISEILPNVDVREKNGKNCNLCNKYAISHHPSGLRGVCRLDKMTGVKFYVSYQNFIKPSRLQVGEIEFIE